MAGGLFEGLGSLVEGLSGFMPQDDPNVKIIKAQKALNDLTEQETALYAEIGKQALSQDGPARYGAVAEKLKIVQADLIAAKNAVGQIQAENAAREQQEEAARALTLCPSCGTENAEGVKFCQTCGTKLGASACPGCGTSNPPGTSFCGSCGTKLI